MPRSPRLHVPGAFYHVTLRGNHRQSIFFTAADRQLLDEITAEVLDRFASRLHAYCWMTNHIHMVVQVADTPLGKLMLRIASRYARTVQKHLNTTGHLFEKRYHSVLVDADEYLLELVRYVHLNPVRAGIVAHPSEYTWSSHHAYLGTCTQPSVTTDCALSLFHHERNAARAAYSRFVDRSIGTASTSPLALLNASEPRILGSDDFAARLLGVAWKPRAPHTLTSIVQEACALFSVTEAALLSRSSKRTLTKARAWIAHQAVALRVTSLSDVARRFNRTEAALRHSVERHFKPN